MKGMSLKDKWVFWRNREVLYSLREFSLHRKLKMSVVEGKERR
jgi:hypothetical protein